MKTAIDAMDPHYLKWKYSDRYRVYRGEDGIWNLCTRFKPKNGLVFDVYVYGKGRLAALLPAQAGGSLMREFPDSFTLHQDADDGKVLLFKESDLGKFAERLKLKKRRRLTEDQRAKASVRLRPFHFKAQVKEGADI